MIIGHGGNIKDLAKELGCAANDIIDMSSNLNPLGPPETIEKVICDNLYKIKSLPEPDAVTMRKGFAGFHSIDETNVIAGNGTTWFIYTIPKALGSKKVLILGPTYSDYKDACLMYNIDFQNCIAKDSTSFDPDIDDLSQMAKWADTVFICNPNNPTGSLISRQKLEYLIQKHDHTVFIVDESYLPFVDQANEVTLVSKTGYENLIVLSSMSKIFRIPGLRTGFLSARKPMVEKIMAYYQPWSVNALAQAVIEHIFDHPERIEPFYQNTRNYIKTEKQHFLESLKDIKGLKLFDSSTYFVLARLTNGMTAEQFCKKIGQQKILIRDCSNFFGLSDQYVRFSLKNRRINQCLSDLIKQALKND
ncbi:MAG: aminotransferase class I/II-fold pyridoxal phosphate-dependent enzyme [Proteobacteria bacterium]|nr:aminotransferase class I/II-fold pyridoxal phosphate-dependent enzyme [Pseudomonadota bacterium]MBU1586069.1 aminotransferase class I/II-fold pyridoxal phosphate-dependent enzyme [Pseudomonadota bacterium]MBU2453231.1 aminotransferase class I/II-fold pyridoxal phosphate-dependent enzyme [Pseudomonadota bacterium]MBU2628318.1 aminotransferase class I/II-fold pyridoxal phosphate-dependent enzyme [Pseudomonadota bacterium]